MLLAVITAFCTCLFSCTNGEVEPIVIWTDRPEFASYSELFNATHEAQTVVVYKENASRSIPPAKDETPPDLVIASWLKSSSTKKKFAPIENLFGERKINRDDLYENLVSYGSYSGTQYLLPVSFNLPAIIFEKKNSELVQNPHTITIDEIQTAAQNFNSKDTDGEYTTMGYAPSWDGEFMYLLSKIKGAHYRENDGSTFTFNADAVSDTVTYLSDWSSKANYGTAQEKNFKFKYLYMPKYSQFDTGRSLFTYMTSREFFSQENYTTNLSLCWISDGTSIPAEDDIVCLGKYKKARHPHTAEIFIEWLFSPETQSALLERTNTMKLDTHEFGIAGGFSSLKEVNSRLFPSYYRELLGNLPDENNITLPDVLPSRWLMFKDRVIIPYFEDASDTTVKEEKKKTLSDRLNDWTRQAF